MGAPRRRRPVGFAVHQLLEYIVAVLLVLISVHIGHSQLLVVAGAIFGLLALTPRGPLGVIRVCGLRLHALLDVIAAILLAAAPLIGAFRPDLAGIVVMEVVAVAWIRLTMLTRYSPRAEAKSAGGVPVPAISVETTGPERGDGAPGPALAAIRNLGRMTAGARTRIPETKLSLDAGARRMGGHAGRLQRAWRRASR